MCKANQQGDQKRPLSVYIMIAAVVILDLSLVYFVNVELLPLIFGIDRELYHKSLTNVVVQTATTAMGVFFGLVLFYVLDWSPQKPSGEALQKHVSAQGNE
jgi:hypothetical protein